MQCQLFQSSWCYWHSFFRQAMQMHSQVSAGLLEIKLGSIIWLDYSNQSAIQRMNQVANRFASQSNEWVWMLCFQTTFHKSTMLFSLITANNGYLLRISQVLMKRSITQLLLPTVPKINGICQHQSILNLVDYVARLELKFLPDVV